MDPRGTQYLVFKSLALMAVVASLSACQQTRNSSAPTPAPSTSTTGGGTNNGGGGGNGGGQVIPPTTPPSTNPPQVIPPGPGGGTVIPPRPPMPPPLVPPTVINPPVVVNPPLPPPVRPPMVPPPTVNPPVQPPVVVNPPGGQPPIPPIQVTPPSDGGTLPPISQPPVVTPAPVVQPPVIVTGGPVNIPPAPPVSMPSVIVTAHHPNSVVIVPGQMRTLVPQASSVVLHDSSKGVRMMTPTAPSVEIYRTCTNEKTCTEHEKDRKTCPPIEMRTEPYSNKLDILLVVDTSASMKQEREEIANQLEKFVRELDPNVTFRLGVLLGHGPDSTKATVGQLYPIDTNQTVINVEATDPETRAKVVRAAAQKLASAMRAVPNDSSDVEGEAGLLNLYSGVGIYSNLSRMQDASRESERFWRKDAVKLVVFVGDENDVCYDYSAASAAESKAGKKVTISGNFAKIKDKSGREFEPSRSKEERAFRDPKVCANSVKGQRLTPQNVFDAVTSSTELPVIFTGILYLNNDFARKKDIWAGDNEMGRGYLDVIALGRGKALDLDSHDFGSMLAKIGDYSNFRRKAEHSFPMHVSNVNDLRADTVRAEIICPSREPIQIKSETSRVMISPETNEAHFVANYKEIEKHYLDELIQRGCRVSISYVPVAVAGPSQKGTGAGAPTAHAVNAFSGQAGGTSVIERGRDADQGSINETINEKQSNPSRNSTLPKKDAHEAIRDIFGGNG